jgi:formate hydrogenlyase subunit 4
VFAAVCCSGSHGAAPDSSCLGTGADPELLFIAAAPLLAGWVKRVKCHLQNRAAPSLFQPYRDLLKLFRKDVVLAENASWLFRTTPYVVFGAFVLAASVVPLVAAHLPTAAIADMIVLVGFFALARFFLALAGMDVGTAFGSLGARREMTVASLAELAMLMAGSPWPRSSTTNLSAHRTQSARRPGVAAVIAVRAAVPRHGRRGRNRAHPGRQPGHAP